MKDGNSFVPRVIRLVLLANTAILCFIPYVYRYDWLDGTGGGMKTGATDHLSIFQLFGVGMIELSGKMAGVKVLTFLFFGMLMIAAVCSLINLVSPDGGVKDIVCTVFTGISFIGLLVHRFSVCTIYWSYSSKISINVNPAILYYLMILFLLTATVLSVAAQKQTAQNN